MDSDGGSDSKVLLYIEDNPDNVLFMTSFIEVMEGWSIVVCKTAEEGIDYVGVTPVDLILTDVNLPGMNGIEAVRRLRAMPGFHGDFPIFAISADATQETIDVAKAAGVTRYLTKPTRLRELRALLESLPDSN
jgi:CheY-like chemotaxis protein